MLNIPKINTTAPIVQNRVSKAKVNDTQNRLVSLPSDLKSFNSENLKAYHPSFAAVKPAQIDTKQQINTIKAKLDKNSQVILSRLEQKGVLADNSANDGSTVLDNLYKIATEPRIIGLNDGLILAEVLKALDNPYSITQKFGDIPEPVAQEISQETGTEFPQQAYNVVSSSCVATSMEFNLADKKPAEFARFAQCLSGSTYSVDKNIKLSNIADGTAEALWKLREFNTTSKVKDWDNFTIKLQPDRNAIVRARVQTSYKDPNERSCVDVLIQSALLNLCSQASYNALTDERSGKFNNDKTGLTDFEKNFGEEILFEKPKVSVVYQNLDENGFLVGYNCEPAETKQHILKSLELGENVIIGYTHLDENKQVDGGHEITIVGYETDEQGNGIFICNDTDDDIDSAIKIAEKDLLPLIHHAGISKEALDTKDVVVESWREILDEFQAMLKSEKAN